MSNETNFLNYNKITISGTIIKEYPLRKTLNQKNINSFIIKHESLINENSHTRLIKCKLYCIVMDEAILIEQNLLNKNVTIDGFMSQNANGNLVLYVKQIKFYKGL
jgi:primosomal replication protein N